jgi:hypothetical protein
MTKMTQITERLARDEYRVDTDAVATALVERLLAGRTVIRAPRGA